MNSVEILDKKDILKKRAEEIINQCKTEVRTLTEDEDKEINSIKEQINALNEEMRQLEKELETYDEKIPQDEIVEERTNNNLINKTEKKMNKEFRLVKAIRDIANNKQLDEVTSAVIAKGQEEMRKSGLNFGGQIQLPTEERAAITVTAEHNDVIETEFENLLAPLRAKNVLANAGAKYLSNLVGDVQVPIMGASSVGWAGEVADAADGASGFTSVTLSPKRLTAYIDISKQFLAQDSIDAENMIKQDLVNAISTKLEETILGSASGSTTQPEGIFHAIPMSASTSAITAYSGVCDAESTVEDSNILGQPVYVMSNKAKAVFRAMPKSSKSTQLVYEGGELDGTPVFSTSNISDKKFIYGDFSNLVIGNWGGIDLTVDPYTKAAAGQVRLVINAFFDAKVVRPEAFVTGAVA